ncbi:MAG TPA: 2-phospho-L-lactate transferase [Actinomycetota bacterium]|nr:2-phospho-L-lactate transferase [Actinomycetota bacterium]
MTITALAGGVGAGKFLRGLIRVVPEEDVTVVVNTGDDIWVHGLYVSPDLDSVTYWLAGVADRDRGWGREGESFRATEQLRAFGAPGAWFGLGDLDLATHLFRTRLMAEGRTLSEATREVTGRLGITARIVPMSDDPVTTRVEVVDEAGRSLDLHFQEYWVLRGARDEVKSVRFDGAEQARPAHGVLDAIAKAEIVVICPSNPIVSIDPILAVPGVREAVAARRQRVVAISPIVGGAPLRGMADRLLPTAGVDVSAAGVAEHYAGLIGGFVLDQTDRDLVDRILRSCDRARVTDTIMVDDAAAEHLARETLDVARAARGD